MTHTNDQSSIADPRVPFVSRLLVSTCFAVVAAAFARCVMNRGGPQVWLYIPLCSGLGAGLTTWFAWPRIAGREESVIRSGLAGLLIGLLAHPVSAALTCIVIAATGILGVAPDGLGVASIQDALAFAVGWIFMWTLCALMSIGWLSALVGAVSGLLIGAIYRGVRKLSDQRRQLEVAGKEVALERQRRLAIDEQPWDSLLAGLISLALLTAFSSGMVLRYGHWSEAEQNVPIMQKMEPVDDPPTDLGDASDPFQ